MKIFAFLIILISLISCSDNPERSIKENTPNNGDLDNTFKKEVKTPELTPEEKLQKEKEKLLAEGWTEDNIPNGPMPPCYNFIPKRGKVDNYLEVSVGGGTDVVIKVMNMKTEKCIRYVFINRNSTYQIKNIPEGTYYLKIAYGKNWLSKVENKSCKGKFIRNAMYEKGTDILDFNIEYSNNDSYRVPSFKLELNVIESDISSSFDSQSISEDLFNQ